MLYLRAILSSAIFPSDQSVTLFYCRGFAFVPPQTGKTRKALELIRYPLGIFLKKMSYLWHSDGRTQKEHDEMWLDLSE